jgi:hypothetical protein
MSESYVAVPRVHLDEWARLLQEFAESRGLGLNARNQMMETSGAIAYWAQQRGGDSHIVAAELRRQADALDEWAAPGIDTLRLPEPMTLQVTARRLRARADELDGGTS